MSATGHVDALTSSGYVEGWAHDPQRPGHALQVSVRMGGREIGCGLASRFRWDLAKAGVGIGWCAFRIRVEGTVSALRRGPLLLTDPAGSVEICRAGPIPVVEDRDALPATVDAVIRADPTVLHSVEQLRGCGPLFDRYVASCGAEHFVRGAYLYILARPADPGGLAHYAARLAEGEISPFDVLNALHESDEFRASPRLLGAPIELGFVFATE